MVFKTIDQQQTRHPHSRASFTSIMADVSEIDLKFDSKALDELPAEKQPYHVLTWVNKVISYVEINQPLEEATQTFIVTELNDLIKHIDKSKELPALISKPIRLELGKAYQAVYSGIHKRLLFETVGTLVKYVSATKPDRYSEFKQ